MSMDGEMARVDNKDCDLCGTVVHIETEYLGHMMGCVYCAGKDHEHKFRFTLWEEVVHCILDDCSAEMGIGGIENALDELVVARRRIAELETALTEVVHIFDNGIDADDWDAHEERMRKALE